MKQEIKNSILVIVLLGVTSLQTSIAQELDGASFQQFQLEGIHCLQANKYQQALESFEAALKIHSSWQTMQNIGICHMELGDYDAAITYFQKSIDAGGLHSNQCKNLGGVYQRRGDNKKALAWLTLACSIDPAAADKGTLAVIRHLQDPLNNPTSSATAADYIDGLQVHKWPKTAMPLKVYVRENRQVPGLYDEFKDIVRESLYQWCKASGHAVSYKFVDTAEAANVTCDYTDKPDLVRPDHDLVVEGCTVMEWREEDNMPKWAKIVLLVRDNPQAPFRDRALLTKQCLHEMGHALGLRGHSANCHDVLFSNVNVPSVSAKLSERDKNTIKKVYQQ